MVQRVKIAERERDGLEEEKTSERAGRAGPGGWGLGLNAHAMPGPTCG